MTLDGKIATRSGPEPLDLRRRGRGKWSMPSAAAWTPWWSAGRRPLRDDPLLTARPPGRGPPRAWCWTPAAALPSQSRLVRTAAEAPAAGGHRQRSGGGRLPAAARSAGCEVLVCPGATHAARLDALLAELGRRQMTNVLVEGGGRVLGSLLDARQIDEVHVFIAPKLVGGDAAPGSGRPARAWPSWPPRWTWASCSSSRSTATCIYREERGIWGFRD